MTPLVRLGDVAAFIRGITFKPEDVVLVGTMGAVGCMRTKNVQAQLDLSDVWGIPESFVKRGEQYLTAGDILVSSANSWNLVGKCCPVPTLPWPSTFGGFVSVLRPDSVRVDPRYLFHWFSSSQIQATVRTFGQRTTNISNLNVERCLGLLIPLPSLAEQQWIASILEKADLLRGKRRSALDQLDFLCQSIFQQLFGDLRHRTSRWPVVRFETIVSETKLGLVRGSNEFGPDLPIPYVRMNAITKTGELDLTEVQGTNATQAEIDAYRLKPGDFLFNTRNSKELVGKTALYRGNGLHVFNNNVMRIRFIDDANPEFVAAAFKTEAIQNELNHRKSGTTNVFAIYYKDLRTLPVPLPPIGLQRAFAERARVIQQLRMAQRSELAAQDALFTALQHRAFRGELTS
jgi:type I restriction enzyme S subunit